MLKIALVDDNPDQLLGLQDALEECGVEAQTFTNPLELLAWLKAHPVQAVLSDFKMPQMDGLELLSQAAKIQPQALLFMMTAADLSSLPQGAKKVPRKIFNKPFAAQTIAQYLSQELSSRETYGQNSEESARQN
jgi:DNA-binding NtrC family response regulator